MRIEKVAQAVAQQVEGQRGEAQGQTGEGGRPPGLLQVILRVGDHGAPLRRGRLHSQAQEAEAGGGQDGVAHVEAGLHQDRRDGVEIDRGSRVGDDQRLGRGAGRAAWTVRGPALQRVSTAISAAE